MAEFTPNPIAEFTPTPIDEEERTFVPQAFVPQPVSETQESTTQEIAEGIASGLLAIPQGIAELGAAGIDLAFDTSYSRDVTEAFDGIREAAGIDPEGAAGEIAEVVSQFVVPGLGAAGVVSKLSRVKNLPNFARKATQIGAAGVTDAVVATDGVTTIGDFFDAGPTQTIDTIGLEGRELAAARIANKLKFGIEATGAAAAVEPALKAVGFGGKMAVKATAPIVSPVARGVLATGKAIGKPIADLAQEDTLVGNGVNSFLSVFRSRGNMTQEMFEESAAITGKVEADINQAATTLRQIEQSMDRVLKESEEVMADGSPLARSELNNRLYAYLTGETELTSLPTYMRQPSKLMRKQVDKLSRDILNSDYLSKSGADKAALAIQENIGSYLRRRYKIFEDKAYTASDEFITERGNTVQFFKDNPELAKKIGEELNNIRDGDITELATGLRLTDEYAQRLTDDYINQYSASGRKLPKADDMPSRVAKNKIKTGLFATRQAVPEQLRRLLGEIKDPQEAFISTVADMAEFRAVDDFYKYINRELMDGESGMFITRENYNLLPESQKAGYRELGKGFGSLEGSFASKRIHNDLTSRVIGDTGTMGNLSRALYSGFLRAKGASQASKTIYSPITQVRNVTSAGLFATMQGNVGAGANLFDSVGLVWNNINKRVDKADYFQKLQRLGVVGTQAQVREIDRLISEGLGGTRSAEIDVLGLPSSGSFADTFKRGKMGSFLTGVGTKARNFYQGGDDIWKVYNFEFEKNKILKAFGSEAEVRAAFGKSSDEYAADIVKNTVPNYERVPEIIKSLRKLPVGNFIAFPAEIIRTSANTLKQALDELAFKATDDMIQKFGREKAEQIAKARNEIGMRRLMGSTTTMFVAPLTIQKMAMDLTGIDNIEEQMEAIRETAAPWQKNSRLIPTSVKDGRVTGYIDYSYTNPYDYLQRPFLAVLNAVNRGEDMGSDTSKIASDAILGAVKEIFDPFASESIVTERIVDTTLRNGRTQTGAKVYREEDTVGDKAMKSFFHVADSFVPGAVPVTLKGMRKETQEPGMEPGRFARSLMSDTTDPNGNERRVAQEVFRAFTGITENEVKPENIMMYRGYEYGRALQSTSQIFNTAVSTRSQLDPQNAIDTYRAANEARFRVMNEMFYVIENMRKLGISDSEIRRTLRKNKVANASDLLRGKFVPFVPSREIKKKVRENDNRLPRAELNAIRREFRQRKLGVQPEAETQELETRTFVPKPVAAAAPPPPAVAQAGVAPAQMAAPAPTSRPQDAGGIMSFLSGGNPIDAIKNLQIFQRTQQ
jgi:hypothetical protein|tara:strand:- start:5450 stop:9340 length:3891 start_codon:yes stop_codon:yes gene_type:complete